MEKKIGVYICECGPNIAQAVDIDTVIEAVAPLNGVAIADKYKLLCSVDGKKFIADQIREHGLLLGCVPMSLWGPVRRNSMK